MTLREFLDDMVKNYNDFTRGDLQGCIEAWSDTNGYNAIEILQAVDDLHDLSRREFFIQMADRLSNEDYDILHDIDEQQKAIYRKLEGGK